FSVSTTPFLQCVAVSTSGDPTGSYFRYAFQYSNFPDYPKMGVWPDGYYETFNLFNAAGTAFLGPEICAYDRAKMLAGAAGTTQELDSLADRLMYRLAYRNFGDHESLVLNHAVTAGSSSGVRWYEIRTPGTTPTVYQQGTYAPDATFRWMGSVAQDSSGNIALGFSTSSSSTHPGIHYTGHLTSDPL